MNEDNQYRDPIISVFKEESNSVDNAAIKSLIEQQELKDEANEQDLRNAKLVLDLYTELLKIEFFIEKTWDIKTLETSVVVKFESYNDKVNESFNKASGWNEDDSFYKDVSLKCIKNCEKISSRLSKFQFEMNKTRNYISSAQERILEDSVTLLLEIWFTCNRKLKFLRNKIAGIFLRSKLLVIDYELESFKDHLSDDKVIPSYRSFMKILVEQLQDAENLKDQSLLDECLVVFMDIEAMFNSLHVNMLQVQNKFLRDTLSSEERNDFNELDEMSNDTLNGHSRSSSVSTGTDISCMMERTNLSKELPNLLAAFNNAKRLEKEIENVRTLPKTNILPSLSQSSISLGSDISNDFNVYSNPLFKSKLAAMEQHKRKMDTFVLPISYGKSPINSRGSSVLSNLYGINKH